MQSIMTTADRIVRTTYQQSGVHRHPLSTSLAVPVTACYRSLPNKVRNPLRVPTSCHDADRNPPGDPATHHIARRPAGTSSATSDERPPVSPIVLR